MIDCMVSNTLLNIISVISHQPVHLSMHSWKYLYQCFAQYSFQANGCFPNLLWLVVYWGFNTLLNIISVISHQPVHLSMHSWKSLHQCFAQYSFQANGCFPNLLWLVVYWGFNATLTAKVISWQSVMHVCFLAFSHQY